VAWPWGSLGDAISKHIGPERTQDAEAFAARLKGVFEGFELRGLSQRQMVGELNGLGIKAPRGGMWKLKQVQRVLCRVTRPPNSPHREA
jgi:hypothetical protein